MFDSALSFNYAPQSEVLCNQFSPIAQPCNEFLTQSTASQTLSKLDKDIILINETTQESLTFNKPEIALSTKKNEFCVRTLIEHLKKKHPQIANSLLFIWDDMRATFELIGQDPMIIPIFINLDKFRNSNTIYIMYKPMNSALKTAQYLPSTGQLNENTESGQQLVFMPSIAQILNENASVDQQYMGVVKKPRKKKQMKPEKRIKERKISEVIEKVAEWRNLHETGSKINLDKAANMVGISRKTLDDYNLQMRRARDFGFDFEKNSNEKMGLLRKFVKSKQDEQLKLNSNNDDNNNRKISCGDMSTADVEGQNQSSSTSEMKEFVDIDLFINNSNNNNNIEQNIEVKIEEQYEQILSNNNNDEQSNNTNNNNNNTNNSNNNNFEENKFIQFQQQQQQLQQQQYSMAFSAEQQYQQQSSQQLFESMGPQFKFEQDNNNSNRNNLPDFLFDLKQEENNYDYEENNFNIKFEFDIDKDQDFLMVQQQQTISEHLF